ncbi:MAG TPA: hypothetical protein VK602_14790 [Phyllobacterium sp.]|nr:hypothetical protein [Phyllobacterium sp.]
MSKDQKLSKISGFFRAFGSAVAVAEATRLGHQPVASDLRALGIDPVQFKAIYRS